METSLPPHAIEKNKTTPVLLPPELTVEVFSQLASLSDILSLSATCRYFHQVWMNNTSPIYNKVAPKCIPCEQNARSLLADQGGPPKGATQLSTKDVVRILRNSEEVEKAIVLFEKNILKRVRSPGYEDADAFAPKYLHPNPHLTRCERSRFTRAYYQLWGMLKLDTTEQQSRLESMTLKQLYHLYEISKLPHSIGGEEVLPADWAPDYDCDPYDDPKFDPYFYRSAVRIALDRMIWAQFEIVYQSTHGEGHDGVWVCDRREGYMSAIATWKHWDESMKMDASSWQPEIDPPRDIYERRELRRDDSSDDEQ